MSNLNISAILPTYNRAHLLERAIISALRQLESGDELIIVDDGSTDYTENLLLSYKNKIRYIKISHSGAGAARNVGVRSAVNPLVVFLDSDDEWMPNRIALQRVFMGKRPDLLFSFSNFGCKDPDNKDGKETRFALITWSKDLRPWSEILGPGETFSSYASLPEGMSDFYCYFGNLYISLLSTFYINVNTLMVRREEAGNNLKFSENTKITEDWECTALLARTGRCAYLDCELAWQYFHSGPRITDTRKIDFSEAEIEMTERIWGKDENFLKDHRELYNRIIKEKRLNLAKGYLLNGKTKKAHQVINQLSGAPIVVSILANLPSSIVKVILSIRKAIIFAYSKILPD